MSWRYQKIHSKVWRDEKFITLSEKSKFLFLYLLTGPHNNIIGAYVLPKAYVVADLKWSHRAVSQSLNQLIYKNLIAYDEGVQLLIIPKQLKHNTLENPNQITSAIKVLGSLPDSPLYNLIIGTLEQFGKQFHEPLIKQLAQRLPKPETETETETGTEPEIEKEKEPETETDILRKRKKPKCADKDLEIFPTALPSPGESPSEPASTKEPTSAKEARQELEKMIGKIGEVHE